MIAAAAKDIDQATRIDRQRAMRALLQSPLLSAAGRMQRSLGSSGGIDNGFRSKGNLFFGLSRRSR